MEGKRNKVIKGQITDRIAACKVTEKLLSARIITAQPHVDVNGADLLAIINVEDGAKFARVQCKGRTLPTPKSKCSVDIPTEYVAGTFTCLLYIHCLFDNSGHLFCFFSHDIKSRNDLWKQSKKYYSLRLYAGNFKNKFDLFYFDESRIDTLREIIKSSDTGKEFYYVFAKGNATMPSLSLSASG